MTAQIMDGLTIDLVDEELGIQGEQMPSGPLWHATLPQLATPEAETSAPIPGLSSKPDGCQVPTCASTENPKSRVC